MQHKPLISIVVPVYNMERYLHQCLVSIAAQTYERIETIVVVDGATDGSLAVARDFCRCDGRFSAVWQENAGSGPTRNAGMRLCRGELVMFVDPDDWIEPRLVAELYEAQREGDYDLVASRRTVVTCSSQGKALRTDRRGYLERQIVGQREVREAFAEMMEMGVVSNPTQKLYKMKLIRDYGIEFPTLRRSQDVVFNSRYYDHIASLRLIAYSGYNYRLLLGDSDRTPADYASTIAMLYDGYKALYDGWQMAMPESRVCTHLFAKRVYGHLQTVAAREGEAGWSMTATVDDQTLQHIARASKPDRWYMRVAQRLMVERRVRLLRWFLLGLRWVKRRVLRVVRLER